MIYSTADHSNRQPQFLQIYRQYGIKIALVGLQSWRTKDLINVEPSPADTLKSFNIYRQEKLLNIYPQHDVSVLMTLVNRCFYEGAIVTLMKEHVYTRRDRGRHSCM